MGKKDRIIDNTVEQIGRIDVYMDTLAEKMAGGGTSPELIVKDLQAIVGGLKSLAVDLLETRVGLRSRAETEYAKTQKRAQDDLAATVQAQEAAETGDQDEAVEAT